MTYQPNSQKTTQIGVFINVPGLAANRMISGFYRYARTHRDWRIFQFPSLNALGSPKNLSARFALDALVTNQADVLRAFARTNGRLPPYVLMDSTVPHFPTKDGIALNVDNVAVGRAAAERLRTLGYQHFAYLGLAFSASASPESADFILRYSAIRKASFERTVAEFGSRAHVFSPSRRDGSFDWHGELTAWLRALPRPCGILAFSDDDVSYAIPIAQSLRISVPRELGFLGIDNEDYICENSTPTIASIEPEYEAAGHQAAAWLDDMLSGRPAPRGTRQTYGVREIEMRQSVCSISGTENRVLRARDVIRNAKEPLSPERLAATLGVSRRMLERAFHETCGHGIYAELLDRRLKAASTLLKSTRRPVGEIATLCGFASYGAFAATFRRHYNCAPGDLRRRT